MLREIIDKFYLEKDKDRDRQHFYVTDAGRCPRSIFFKFKNAPKKDLDPNILRLFDHGEHIHRLIMKSLLSTRDIHVVASEVNIPKQEIISGRADAILSDGKDLYVLDIKSINGFLFRKLDQPKEENLCQLQLYLHFFGIKKGILLYVNKNDQHLKEFAIDYNKKQAEELMSSLEKLNMQIDNDKIPARLFDYPRNKHCRYCEFKDVCKMSDPGEMKWISFKEKIQNMTN